MFLLIVITFKELKKETRVVGRSLRSKILRPKIFGGGGVLRPNGKMAIKIWALKFSTLNTHPKKQLYWL